MFWRSANFAQPSPIEGILERGDFTLEEILDDDDVIQECKSLNSRLVLFLRDRQVVEKLLRYLVEPPPEAADVKRRYKYPYMACEIFTCEIDGIFSTIFEGAELLDLFFSLLDRPSPLPPVLAGYFAKVVSSLLTRRTTDCMTYLKGHQHIFGSLVKHLGTTSVAEVVMQLVGAQDQLLMFHAEALQWLGDTSLLELILDSLAPNNPPAVHANAAEVLTAIARTLPSALAKQLASPMYLQRLFTHASAPGFVCQQQGLVLDVCMALLEPKRSELLTQAGVDDSKEPEILEGPPPMLVDCCLSQLDQLVPQLSSPSEESVQHTTYGELEPPLGTLRLKIVEFISVLVRSVVQRSPELQGKLQDELLRLKVMYKCLALFFEYPFHSLLHNHVGSLLMVSLESNQQPLLVHLLDECKLLTALAAAPQEVKPKGGKNTLRCGYLGHISLLGNKVCELLEKGAGGVLVEATENNGTWQDWVSIGLRDRNQVENLMSWQCGRPAQADEGTNESDNEDDVLNTDFGMGSVTNKINDVYHRYGDDESDDKEESDDNEESALFIDSTEVLAGLDFQTSTQPEFVSLQMREHNINTSDSDSDSDGDDPSSASPADAFTIQHHDEDEVLIVTSEDEEDVEV